MPMTVKDKENLSSCHLSLDCLHKEVKIGPYIAYTLQTCIISIILLHEQQQYENTRDTELLSEKSMSFDMYD